MKNTLVLLLVFMMVSVFGLTGCSSGEKPLSEDTQTEQPGDTSTVTDEQDTNHLDIDKNPALSRGNILTVSTTALDGKFNPVLSDNAYDAWVVNLIFEGLITNDIKGNPVPAAARAYDISEDKRTYTFYLNEGLTFHDGQPLTADDVAFTYYTMADPDYDGPRGYAVSDLVGIEAYKRGEKNEIEGIEVINDATISFTIVEPNVQKIYDFSYGIMPRHIYQYNDWAAFKAMMSNPIGSGVMRFEEYKSDMYIRLMTNRNYHGGRANIDGVTIMIQPTEVATTLLSAGEIDVANPSANIENYDTMTSSGIVNVQEFTSNGYGYIGFNLRNPKLSDVRVRQALAYGLDRETFIENQWDGFASVCNAPISPVSWAYPDVSKLNAYTYDPEKAKALLEEAGWVDSDGDGIREKNGLKLSLLWTAYNNVDWPINLIALAKDNWKEIGVELESELMAFNTVYEKVFDRQDFELWNMGWTLAIDPDPIGIFDKASDVLGGYNAGGYYNERAEEIFKEGLNEYDQKKRAALYQEWAVIANEELPYLFNAYRNEIWGVNKRVKGMTLGPYFDWTYTISDIVLEHVD
jgi:peptide/nickel transport system substrate-binding protein